MRSEVCQCKQRLERNGVHGVLHHGLVLAMWIRYPRNPRGIPKSKISLEESQAFAKPFGTIPSTTRGVG